jgi:threonine/homoserine/homoserine lactone efflux protein
MIEAIISGIGFGLVLTFITGPVFFALIKTSIEKGFHAGVALALGRGMQRCCFCGGNPFRVAAVYRKCRIQKPW